MPEAATVQGIVLRRRDSGESDRRLTLLTVELGRIDVVAKGARKPTSRFAGVSEPLCIGRYTYAVGKANQFLTQASPSASFRGIRADYDRLNCALCLCELYAGVVPAGDPLGAEAYPLLVQALQALQDHPRPLVALVWAEMQLLEWSGFSPSLEVAVDSDEPLPRGVSWVSPQAGGFVSPPGAIEYPDRFRAPYEVLTGLARVAECEEPPPNLKLHEECLVALFPFWRNIVEGPLLANESMLVELRHRLSQSQV